ncbi:hypothetical protein MKZ38_005825 [Zalerion maritima]|uniref:GTP-binding protein n=1 Tax=Zalerion maritima TaxID=339359 RepID=A0AAD5RVU9_9PEZI|nr:hypothetical protein MKZ38_005825 [Zalerion maritima]
MDHKGAFSRAVEATRKAREGTNNSVNDLNTGNMETDASTVPRPGNDTAIKKPKKKKVLLMGKSGSGKSSMRSIIFSNYLAKDTRRLGATIDIDLSHVKFLGNLTLNLWDCGGQEAFMENYLSQQRVHVFSNVGVLIYVFDIDSHDVERDLATYQSILSALQQFSPGANIFILIHKMDLVKPELRESVFTERSQRVRDKTKAFAKSWARHTAQVPGSGSPNEDEDIEIQEFATSIWDQSLYKAWASIIHDLVPNLAYIEKHLEQLGKAIEAEELMLFERTSFLVVSYWASKEGMRNPYSDRQERMSNILKSWKQSISRFSGTPRSNEQFRFLDFKSSGFSVIVIKFTINTFLLAVLPPGEARFNSAKLNIEIASETFAFLDVPGQYAKQPAQPTAATTQPTATAQAGPSTQQQPADDDASPAGPSTIQPAMAGLTVQGEPGSQQQSASPAAGTKSGSPSKAAGAAGPSSASTTEVESATGSGDEPQH